jgi:hypothetical protein
MALTRPGIVVALGAAIVLAGATSAGAQSARKLEITFNDGKVTIIAENVTVRDVLQEWSRKGGSRIVNADRLGGAALPYLEFRDEPEAAVLRSLLRDVPGYGAAPRIAPDAASSTIAAVFILASRSVPVSGASSAGAPMVQAPPPSTPQPAPQPLQGSPDSEIPPARQIGELPPSTPGGQSNTNSPNLRSGPGGTVTSTIPGVVIPIPEAGRAGGPPAGPGTTGPQPGRGGRGGGGGGLR